LGPTGLQVGDELVEPDVFAALLNDSEVRLVVLNGCEGGRVSSPLAVEYLTLADRIVRDGRVSEVVAHRVKITDADALAFAILFYNAFFGKSGGFDPARAAFHARKAGSLRLRLSPVVISQR
jgi:CHAT domain-containing protein